MNISRAAVIGTGMMGPGIAATLALGGVATCLVSRTAESARTGLRAAREAILLLEANQLAETAAANAALERLVESSDLDDAIATAQLVIESAPENMPFKQDLFARMDRVAPHDCILASNTSGLSITHIAARCERPERVVTTHFWNPPHLMPLVEIVKGERTSADVVSVLRELLAICGKTPVVVQKDRPGQLGNRLQIALQREAMHIVAEGIASVEDVDTAAQCGFGLRLPVYGLFEHMDAVGLDLAGAVVDYVTQDLNNESGMPPILRDKIRRGATFHDWTVKDMAQVKERRNRFLIEFLKTSPRRPRGH
jgi:3-hydroxybutyryl-CoA dehydrogenase